MPAYFNVRLLTPPSKVIKIDKLFCPMKEVSMPISKIAGKALTVLGPIDGKDLGVTLPHEHLTIDHVKANFTEPKDPADREMAYKPVSYEILHWLRYNRTENKDNLGLPEEKKVIAEALHFKRAGGGTIVDVTNRGINRDPKTLVRISKATGLNIVMGSGYYLATSHPADMDSRTVAPPEEGIGLAVYDRLFKASGSQLVAEDL